MIEIVYNNLVRIQAHEHARRMCESAYKLGRTFFSYKHLKGNSDETAYLGKIAEILIQTWLLSQNINILESPLSDLHYNHPEKNFDSDFVLNTNKKLKLELKTKTINCAPKPHFDVGMSRINQSDIVLFSRIFDARGILYVVGWLPTNEFRKISQFRTVGSHVQNTDSSQFTCQGDEHVCQIAALKSPALLREYINEEKNNPKT